jgi:hypothetical protein
VTSQPFSCSSSRAFSWQLRNFSTDLVFNLRFFQRWIWMLNSHLGYDGILICKFLPTFRRNFCPSLQGSWRRMICW